MKAGLAQAESFCVYVKSEKFMQHMHGMIPELFNCWADPIAHLLLLKSSMDIPIQCYDKKVKQGHQNLSLHFTVIIALRNTYYLDQRDFQIGSRQVTFLGHVKHLTDKSLY